MPFVVKLSVNDGAGIQTKFVAIDSKAVLVGLKFSKIVLGGTAASHTCSGVGGGHFLIKKSDHRHRAGEPPVRFKGDRGG